MDSTFNPTRPNIWIFVSDEGFGHVVRQEAVVRELLKKVPGARITIQTKAKLQVIQEKLGDRVSYCERYNNINTIKSPSGALDLVGTYEVLKQYDSRSTKWIDDLLNGGIDFDFCISDFVPEAFVVAEKLGRPCYGVAHFTWDWLYSLLYPQEKSITDLMESYARKAHRLYFPPFTPEQLLAKYTDLAQSVSFVINEFAPISLPHMPSLKCLIMDNGTNTLTRLIEASIDSLASMEQLNFFLSIDNFSADTRKRIRHIKNIVPILGLKTMHSHIPHVDFVIARGGFNTLTECLMSRTPSLLVEEDLNPEVYQNIQLMTEAGLAGRFLSSDFGPGMKDRINSFLAFERQAIVEQLGARTFPSTGAAEISADILARVTKFYG